MSYLTVKFDGLEKFLRDLESLPDELEQELTLSLNRAAETVLSKALELVPVKTGEIKSSLKLVKPKKSNKKYYISSAVEIGNKKAIPLELGHRVISHGKVAGYAEAMPFLRPAFDQCKDATEEEMIRAFNRIIDKIGGNT